MTASRCRTVIVWVAALGVAVILVAAATTGSSGLVGELRSDAPTGETSSDPSQPEAPTEGTAEDSTSPRVGGRGDRVDWVHDLLAFALLLAGLVLTFGALRLLAQGLLRRLPDQQLVLHLESTPDLEAAREALRRDREDRFATLDGSDVRNGIVTCWVRLEETAAEVGVTRLPAETSTELVVRFLHAVDIDPRPVAALASLYQEARFSTHPLPADARARARQALDGIYADLDWGAVT